MDERALAERLISYDSSTPDGIRGCAAFIKGWLEAREIAVDEQAFGELPVLSASVGPTAGVPTLVFHGHLDVVPGRTEQFSPRVEGDRLYGRGAYDMKGGLAAMMCAVRDLSEQAAVRVRFLCVPDEESEDIDRRSTDDVVRGGFAGDFAITGEPTDLHVGVQAKGVLAFRLQVLRPRGPRLDAVARRQRGLEGDRRVPANRVIALLTRVLGAVRPAVGEPRPDPRAAMRSTRSRTSARWSSTSATSRTRIRVTSSSRSAPSPTSRWSGPSRACPRTCRARTRTWSRSSRAVGRLTSGEAMSVGRDGASDAVSFLKAGIPSVEFGPGGAGHHGPEEWVSISSLAHYRQALVDFAAGLPAALESGAALRAVDGGLA